MQYVNKEKLEKIKLTKSNFYVAVDFDKTITASESVGSWDVFRDVLGEDFAERQQALCEKYEPIETDYHISFEEKNKAMEEWYYGAIQLYDNYHLTLEKSRQAIKQSKLIFRKGAKEFLKNMYENDIPVVILSAGIGNVITQFLEENDCYDSNLNIISNFILFDETGNMKPYCGNIIHTLNKNMEEHITEDFYQKIKDKTYRLLIGDFVEDKTMVAKKEWDKTLMIGILDKKVEDNLKVYQQNFDIVLTKEDASFQFVNKLLNSFQIS